MPDIEIKQEVLDLVAAFGERIGIHGLKPDSEGMLVLRIDRSEYLMAVRPLSEKIHLVKRLMSIPENDADELRLLRSVSELNCFQWCTKGGAVGLWNGALYYSVGLPYASMTPLALESFVSDVIDTVETLVSEIEEAMARVEATTSFNPFDSNNLMFPV